MKHETLVPDDLWEAVEPFLPKEPPKPKGGPPRVPARAALAGIVFVLKTGIPWQMLPTELGCGCGSTCWRRLPGPSGRGKRPGSERSCIPGSCTG